MEFPLDFLHYLFTTVAVQHSPVALMLFLLYIYLITCCDCDCNLVTNVMLCDFVTVT